jgi:hypothetical protein
MRDAQSVHDGAGGGEGVFEFFQTWLVVLGAAIAIAGTAMVLIAGTPAFALVAGLLDRPFWPSGPDETTRRFQAWSYSVTFATLAGWGVALAFIAANAFGSREIWAWWAIAGSVLLWYPLDTGRSLLHHVWINAALNTVLLLAVAIPLAATFGEFH